MITAFVLDVLTNLQYLKIEKNAMKKKNRKIVKIAHHNNNNIDIPIFKQIDILKIYIFKLQN